MQALADQHSSAAHRAARDVTDELAAAVAAMPQPPPPTREQTAAKRASGVSFDRRQAFYDEAARLHVASASISRIAALLSAERKTVRR